MREREHQSADGIKSALLPSLQTLPKSKILVVSFFDSQQSAKSATPAVNSSMELESRCHALSCSVMLYHVLGSTCYRPPSKLLESDSRVECNTTFYLPSRSSSGFPNLRAIALSHSLTLISRVLSNSSNLVPSTSSSILSVLPTVIAKNVSVGAES